MLVIVASKRLRKGEYESQPILGYRHKEFKAGLDSVMKPLRNVVHQAVVAHDFNPSTWEAEAGGFLSSRPAWSTE